MIQICFAVLATAFSALLLMGCDPETVVAVPPTTSTSTTTQTTHAENVSITTIECPLPQGRLLQASTPSPAPQWFDDWQAANDKQDLVNGAVGVVTDFASFTKDPSLASFASIISTTAPLLHFMPPPTGWIMAGGFGMLGGIMQVMAGEDASPTGAGITQQVVAGLSQLGTRLDDVSSKLNKLNQAMEFLSFELTNSLFKIDMRGRMKDINLLEKVVQVFNQRVIGSYTTNGTKWPFVVDSAIEMMQDKQLAEVYAAFDDNTIRDLMMDYFKGTGDYCRTAETLRWIMSVLVSVENVLVVGASHHVDGTRSRPRIGVQTNLIASSIAGFLKGYETKIIQALKLQNLMKIGVADMNKIACTDPRGFERLSTGPCESQGDHSGSWEDVGIMGEAKCGKLCKEAANCWLTAVSFGPRCYHFLLGVATKFDTTLFKCDQAVANSFNRTFENATTFKRTAFQSVAEKYQDLGPGVCDAFQSSVHLLAPSLPELNKCEDKDTDILERCAGECNAKAECYGFSVWTSMSSRAPIPGCRFFDKACGVAVPMSGLPHRENVFPDASHFNPRTFNKISVPKPLVKSGVSYHLRNRKHSDSRLGVDRSNDARIWTHSLFSNDNWQIEELTGEVNPLYRIKNVETGKYLSVASDGYGHGDNVHAEDLMDGCKTCKWQLEQVQKPDVFAFKNAHSGRYLSVATGGAGNANALIGGKDLSLDERKWQLVRVSPEKWTCTTSFNDEWCRAEAIRGTEEYLFVGTDRKCDWDSQSGCATGCCKRRLDCSGAVQGGVRRNSAAITHHECKCEKVDGAEYYLRGNGFWEKDICWASSGKERYFNVIDIINSGQSCTCQDPTPPSSKIAAKAASNSSMASHDSTTASNKFLAAADSSP